MFKSKAIGLTLALLTSGLLAAKHAPDSGRASQDEGVRSEPAGSHVEPGYIHEAVPASAVRRVRRTGTRSSVDRAPAPAGRATPFVSISRVSVADPNSSPPFVGPTVDLEGNVRDLPTGAKIFVAVHRLSEHDDECWDVQETCATREGSRWWLRSVRFGGPTDLGARFEAVSVVARELPLGKIDYVTLKRNALAISKSVLVWRNNQQPADIWISRIGRWFEVQPGIMYEVGRTEDVAGGSRHLPWQDIDIGVVVQPLLTDLYWIQPGPARAENSGEWAGANIFFGEIGRNYGEQFRVWAFACKHEKYKDKFYPGKRLNGPEQWRDAALAISPSILVKRLKDEGILMNLPTLITITEIDGQAVPPTREDLVVEPKSDITGTVENPPPKAAWITLFVVPARGNTDAWRVLASIPVPERGAEWRVARARLGQDGWRMHVVAALTGRRWPVGSNLSDWYQRSAACSRTATVRLKTRPAP